MTVSPYTYCRMLGKILFLIVLPISGSCQSMVYRSVLLLMIVNMCYLSDTIVFLVKSILVTLRWRGP